MIRGVLDYRGLRLFSSQPAGRLVTGFGYKIECALFRKCTPHTEWKYDQLLKDVVDGWWRAGLVKPEGCVSVDRIPWEIHAIDDPIARAEATQSFQMNMLYSDDVRSSSEETG